MRASLRSSRRLVLLAGLLLVAAACHGDWKHYSVAFDQSHGEYDGVSVRRFDHNIDPQLPCNSGYVDGPTYQTQWVLLSPDAAFWVEIGTMHKRADCKYWFWGYGFNSTWNSLGTEGGVVYGAAHTFKVFRNVLSPAEWLFTIDTTVKGDVVFDLPGAYVSAGLESYCSDSPGSCGPITTVPTHSYFELEYDVAGTFHSWSGQEAEYVQAPACGRWISDTNWRAGQNVEC